MAGVIPIVPPRTGTMTGKLDVETERFVTFDELYTHHPQAQTFFDELEKKGRTFFFIDCHCKVMLEMDLESASYVWQMYEAPRGGFAYKLAFDFGRRLPKLGLKKIVSIERCLVNICSKDYARAVTIDLTRNEINYIHDSLWDSRRKGYTEEAKDVLAILQWLIEDKKFTLAVSGGESHYRELLALMGGK
jgi:hypothetical protein